MAERWVPTLGYMLARIDGKVIVLRHGRRHVKDSIPDDEVMLTPIAGAIDYDEGVAIVRALRDSMPPRDEVRDTPKSADFGSNARDPIGDAGAQRVSGERSGNEGLGEIGVNEDG